MNKKLLNQALKHILSQLKKAEAFAIEQAPQICKELWNAGILEAVSKITISSLALLVSGGLTWYFVSRAFYYGTRVCTDQYGCGWGYNENIGYIVLSVLAIIVAVVASGFLVEGIKDLIYMKRCPKLFLVNQIRNLLD